MRVVLQKALAKDPADRYATARELAEALRDARSPSRRQQPIATEVLEAPTVAAPASRQATPAPRQAPPAVRQAQPAAGRSRGLLWAGGAAAVVVGLLLLVPLSRGGWPWGPKPSPSPDLGPSPSGVEPAAPDRAQPLKTPSVLIADAGSLPAAAVPAAAPPATLPVSMPPADTHRARSSPPVPAPSPRPATRATPSAAAAAPTGASQASPGSGTPATPAPAAVPQEPGLLQVIVIPWGDVAVDGKPFGSTPLSEAISLRAGAHLVRVQHPGFEVLERQVTIRAGESQKLVVNLPTQGVRKK